MQDVSILRVGSKGSVRMNGINHLMGMTREEIDICTTFNTIVCNWNKSDQNSLRWMIRTALQEPKTPLNKQGRDRMWKLLYKYRKQIPGTFEKYMKCQPLKVLIKQKPCTKLAIHLEYV